MKLQYNFYLQDSLGVKALTADLFHQQGFFFSVKSIIF